MTAAGVHKCSTVFDRVQKYNMGYIHIQECHSFFENSSNCFLYKHFVNHDDFGTMQPYLRKPIQNNIRKHISRIRLS